MTNEEILARGLGGFGYCSHANPEDIARVCEQQKSVPYANWNDEYGWGPEHDMVALVELQDGTYAVVHESEDSSGHGCICSGSITFHPTLEEAVSMGLGVAERDDFIKSLNETKA